MTVAADNVNRQYAEQIIGMIIDDMRHRINLGDAWDETNRRTQDTIRRSWEAIVINGLREYVRDMQPPIEAPPIPTKPCEHCGGPMSNLDGQYVIRSPGGAIREVCHECKDTLMLVGYTVVAQAKSLS